ncbi:ClpXP protease specificity-enhancing factor SspB [Hyphomicrobium sp.]|uniref:SspB family protein n=1 Tax=Hyphomicrobium sp. TaxID=82 RepID=UPI0025BDCA27|nr:ClpXP protease specificity-enhancing factor SspB [Hyphomicrobium sp.]MCC7251770.1 hypothetical protein [Hyphomicrobium sp.]
MVESTIDYEGLAQEAMRGVVRKVLARTAKSGLAGDHHFYISFDTEAPGVMLSRRLKEKYPHEMTIVLQHRFWDLAVSEDRFEVKLTFDGIPERLVVPFDAIKVFFDPSVRFGLQFEDPNAGPEARAQQAGSSFESLSSRGGATRASHTRKSPRTARKTSSIDGKAAPTNGAAPPAPEDQAATDEAQASATPLAANAGSRRSAPADEEAASSNDAEAPARPGGAEIVSLDKFRKK